MADNSEYSQSGNDISYEVNEFLQSRQDIFPDLMDSAWWTKDKLNDLTQIVGLPFWNYEDSSDNSKIIEMMKNLIIDATPIMQIWPAYIAPYMGDAEKGGRALTMAKPDISKGQKYYKEILRQCGVDNPDINSIFIAFEHEGGISESFNSDYGESMFQGLIDSTQGTITELVKITGAEDVNRAIESLRDASFKATTGIAEWFLNAVTGTLGAVGGKVFDAYQGILNHFIPGLGMILQGNRIDLPLLWKNSSYQPSYSVTVKLKNPVPGDYNYTKKYIVDPLIKILALHVPLLANDKISFMQPLMCVINCPGYFMLKSGALTSVEVIKGGDHNDIAWNMQVGTIQLRLTFTDMYQTMVSPPVVESMSSEPEASSIFYKSSKPGDCFDPFRPTLKDYAYNILSHTGTRGLLGISSGANILNNSYIPTTPYSQSDSNQEENINSDRVPEEDIKTAEYLASSDNINSQPTDNAPAITPDNVNNIITTVPFPDITTMSGTLDRNQLHTPSSKDFMYF